MTETRERRPRADGVRSRAAILRAAANLATIEGLEGVSIGTLAAHIGMSKSGLYAHFGSKEELQLAAVDTALGIFDDEVVRPVESVADPRDRLLALYDRFLDHVERRVFPGGCFFASVETEFDARTGPLHDKIATIQQAWSARLAELVREAQAAGSISPEEDPAQLAFELDAYGLMGNMSFVLHDDPMFLRRAREAIHRRLSAS